MMDLFKVLGEHGEPHHGGCGTWPLPQNGEPGEWLEVEGPLKPCENGLHLCREQDLVHWLGPVIYTAECNGEQVEDEHKIVVRRARLLSRCEHWNKKNMRLFAADCAEHVLHLLEVPRPDDDRPRKAIEAARAFAVGDISAAARDAAGDAAGDAAREAVGNAARDAGAAAREAAEDAAWAAAWAAARAAAWATAWATAGATAGATAWDAAGDAEVEWQTTRLMAYLRGEISGVSQ